MKAENPSDEVETVGKSLACGRNLARQLGDALDRNQTGTIEYLCGRPIVLETQGFGRHLTISEYAFDRTESGFHCAGTTDSLCVDFCFRDRSQPGLIRRLAQ